MMTLFLVGLFAILFYGLGKSADIVVTHVRKISVALGIRVFFIGIILGLFTSLPELSIGVQAFIGDIPDVSFGNFLGGVLVVLGLIFGIGLMLNARIITDGKLLFFLPIVLYIFSPFLLAFDGKIERLEGLLLVVLYLLLVMYLFTQQKDSAQSATKSIHTSSFLFHGFWILVGMLLVTFFSYGIIQITEQLLGAFAVKEFFVGVLVFAIGTNLPELTVMLRAWKSHMKELSMSHMFGSAMVDPLLLGMFSFLRPFSVEVNGQYYNLMLFSLLILLAIVYFYRTGNAFTRREGLLLILMYLAFVLSEVGLLIGRI